jgi:Uma2 family endonuclease
MTVTAIKPRNKPLKEPKLYTYDDLVRLTPPDNGNYEIRLGKIIFMPSPLASHQKISMRLSAYLFFYVSQHKLGEVLAAPMDVRFTPNDVVQPDLLFIANDRTEIIQKIIEGAPDLVIEIKSESNSAEEMGYKKYLYETGGVREYWIIHPEKKIIKQYLRSDEELHLTHTYTNTDTLQSTVLEGFTLEVAGVFL